MRYLTLIIFVFVFAIAIYYFLAFASHVFFITNTAINEVAQKLSSEHVADVGSDFYIESKLGNWINIYNIALIIAFVALILAIFIYSRRR